MIPIKLVETVFQKFWVLILPAVLAPMLVLGLTHKSPEYQSNAVVWVSAPVAGESAALGYNNAWLTPAQNQAQVLNDLLATESFRVAVVKSGNLVDARDGDAAAKAVAANARVWAGYSGANLVTVTAVASSAKEAQSLANGVIAQYSERATQQFQRDSSLSVSYYQQQLAVANQELATRQAALNDYLASHPKAANPANPESQDINYRTLLERVTSQSTLITQLQTSLQAVQLREASAPETQLAAFSVQDPPSLPSNPIPTSTTKTIGLPFAAFLFGLLIGVGYLYFAYRTDHSIRTATDLEPLSVRLLGSVPDLHAGPSWIRWTPVGLFLDWRNRDFARKTAASIAGESRTRGAQEA